MEILISGARDDALAGVTFCDGFKAITFLSGTFVVVMFNDEGVETCWLLLLFNGAIFCSFIVDSVRTTEKKLIKNC